MSERSTRAHVLLNQLPIDLWTRASAHQEAIQREFDILRAELPEDSSPNRLLALIEQYDGRFSTEETWNELQEAAEKGQEEVDLTFTVPAEAAEVARSLGRMLDEVDDFCRAGEKLLTLATPPDLVAFRRWFLGEFTRQIDQGLDPIPWGVTDPREQRDASETATEPAKPEGSESIRFEGDLDLSSAGVLRDQILDHRAAGVKNLTIDLTGVKFMDSVGISLLVSAHNRVTDEGLSMSLIMPERLRPLIEMSGLLELLRPRFVDRS